MRSEVNMDKVILKANFIKPTKADEEFLKKEIFSKNFDQLNVQDAIKAFDALASRLTADKWPQRRDAGHLMLISLCNRLSSCISKINQKEMVDKVTPHVLKACESCIVAGLPASLIDIMKKLVEMIPSEFYKDMPQDRFRMVLGLVHAGRYRPFPNDEQADYAKLNCFEPINNVICSIEKETFRKHFDDLLKTVDYVIREMLTGGESDAIYFDHILYCIRQQCGDHPLLMLKTDCNKLIELIGAYQKLLEQNEVGSEKTQKMVGAVFGVLFTLMRGEILTVGAALGPFIISLLPRVRRLEERRPWLRSVVHDLVSALRIGDKEQAQVFKDVSLESVLPHVRPLLAEVRREPKEWREEVEDIFRLGLMPFCRTDADCQLMFGVFGDYLAWRSGKMVEQIDREARRRQKIFKSALKADQGPFLAMLGRYREEVHAIGPPEDEDDREHSDHVSAIKSSLEEWLKMAQAVKVTTNKDLQLIISGLVFDAIESGVEVQADISSKVASFIRWDMLPSLDPLFKALETMVRADLNVESIDFSSMMADVMCPLFDFAKERPAIMLPHLDSIGSIVDVCLNSELYFDLSGTDFPSFYSHILLNVFKLLTGNVSIGAIVHTVFPRLLRACDVSTDFENFHQAWQLTAMNVQATGEAAEAVCKYAADVLKALDEAVDNDDVALLMTGGGLVQRMCTETPKGMEPHMKGILSLLKRSLQSPKLTGLTIPMLQAIAVITKHGDTALTSALVETLLPAMRDPTVLGLGMPIFENISQKRPRLLASHLDLVLDIAKTEPRYAPPLFDVFERLAEADPLQIERVMATLEAAVDPLLRSSYPDGAVCALVVMRRVGLLGPEALAKRKAKVERWKGEPALHDTAVHLLDVIANRSLAGVDAAVAETKKDVAVIDSRLQDTEDRVDLVNYEVNQHSARLDNVEERADEAEARLDVVEHDVGEMGEEVADLGNKTMTNAPRWSRQVSLLLNPEADADWRLLAQRLGYSPKDVRGWATQHDPCMAVLSEWFATNRTAGATHAVATALREMNRLDALRVVEEAVGEVEGVVADWPEEFESPPPVFLSYQWGHQPEAKMLRKHLEMAGFRCWMDVGSMGGGDKLFEAIDRGLRGAEVMVACVTEKYAKSDNCRRELNLAANINKPIIPLQVERMQWPPAGPMGPLLAEYLFIRVFSKTGAPTAADQPFWPADRFLELLMQIRLHVAPDHGLVRAPYEHWWDPPEEMIVVPARDASAAAAAPAADAAPSDGAPADVFLSYQWGHQPHVKRLYMRLASLGCRCWMDIFQMGGGDSLYDKIDRGVRNAKAVVACVTPKYALSPNCRKEVSLSHALKKPIIPLMLEPTEWPPPGPMSMVFTELLYIGMHKAAAEMETWTGPRSDELLAKLRDLSLLPREPAAPEPPPAPPAAAKGPAKPSSAVNKAPPTTPAAEKAPPTAQAPKEAPQAAQAPREAPPAAQPPKEAPPTAQAPKEAPQTAQASIEVPPLAPAPVKSSSEPHAAQRPSVASVERRSAPVAFGGGAANGGDTARRSKACSLL